METRHVVTCFLTRNGKILIVRRGGKVATYRGKWSAVSGYVEEPPPQQALREVQEETGLEPTEIRLLKTCEPVEVVDETQDIKWIVHPFLFEIDQSATVRLDYENVEARWISPSQLTLYETVPKLKEVLEKLHDVEVKQNARGSNSKHREDSE